MTPQDYAELFIKRLITPADVAAKQWAGRQSALSEHQHKLGHYQRMMANRATNKKGGHQTARNIAGAQELEVSTRPEVQREGIGKMNSGRDLVPMGQEKIPKHRAQGINRAATISAEQATPIR